jgi:hypothetical protein
MRIRVGRRRRNNAPQKIIRNCLTRVTDSPTRHARPIGVCVGRDYLVSGCRDGEIGRRKGLKIPWAKAHAGSIPAPGIDLAPLT